MIRTLSTRSMPMEPIRCPKCGFHPKVIKLPHSWRVSCTGCPEFTEGIPRLEVIKQWNARKPDRQPTEWFSEHLDWNFDASYEGEDESGPHWLTSAICPHCGSGEFCTNGTPWTLSQYECYDCGHKSKEF